MEKVEGRYQATDGQLYVDVYRNVSIDDVITLNDECLSFVSGESVTVKDLLGGTTGENWGMFKNGVFYEKGVSDTGDVSKIRFWKGQREASLIFILILQKAQVMKKESPQ
jgi:hypothetical protein